MGLFLGIVAVQCHVLFAYLANRDGFLNPENVMPGSSGDSRDLPSLPFMTDTNRASDGFTSGAVFGGTAPPFPFYNGSAANNTDRYRYYAGYISNAASQGVCLYGDGDAACEDARQKIVSQTSYQTLPRPNVTFPVHAAIQWNPSGFAVEVGLIYTIRIYGNSRGFGSQLWEDGGIRVDANGYESYYDAVSNCYVALGRCRSHLKKKRRLLSANWMSLSCAIGQFVRPVFNIIPGQEEKARYFPLDEAALQKTVFNVGAEFRFQANHTGELICFANDAFGSYWNNKGVIEVTVIRESWPISNSTYYKSQYIPPCDAAYAVYTNTTCNPHLNGGGWDLTEARHPGSHYGVESH